LHLMMKYVGLILLWSSLIVLGLGVRSAGRLRADPTDDFSFTLEHLPESIDYRMMPEKRVTLILQDRLDRFPKEDAPRLARHLLDLCRRYRFDPAFVLSLIEVESSFRVGAVSPFGAVGLMQVMPATAIATAQKIRPEIGLETGLTALGLKPGETLTDAANRVLRDPYSNLSLGIAYLSWLRDRYRGLSPYHLVAAYNVGPGRMDELLSRKSFKPVTTKRYFDAIRRGMPGFRFYRREA
jgi:soluble lytic murein transglycosylase-like protein